MSKVFIATPSYKNSVSSVYLQSMLEYGRADFEYSYMILPGDSLITRARNYLFSTFYKDMIPQGYTHILWQDDDTYIHYDSITRMLETGYDAVGVSVPLKNAINDEYGQCCNVNGVLERVDDCLYRVHLIGTAALMLSKKLVTKLVEYCENTGQYYFEGEEKIYDIFRVGIRNHLYLSEDWYLCDIIRSLGFSIYADSSTDCIHAEGLKHYTRPAGEINPRCIGDHSGENIPTWTSNDFHVWDREDIKCLT